MDATLGSLLDDARRRGFVGRAAELASFDDALSGRRPHRVLFVHGPGGIGKSTLLQRLRLHATERARPLIELDGRDQTVTYDGMADAVAAAAAHNPAPVLLVDGYELLEPLDDAFRSELLPSLPADAVTVLASRRTPSPAWRSDPGWRSLVVVHELQAFDDDESADLLTRAGVPIEQHAALLRLGRGHPLALALLAAVALMHNVPTGLGEAPSVVDALLPVFVDNVPDDAHALGLEVCAHAWVTTESLLTHVLGDDARVTWRWLESLPFVVRSPLGLYPHDLARDVLEAEHQRRSPDSRQRVHRLVHGYAREQVRVRSAVESHVAALQLLYLHREGPLTGSMWQLRETQAVSVLPGRAHDHREVVDLVEKYEGTADAALAQRWLDTQGDALRVVRRVGAVSAFAFEAIVPVDGALENDDVVMKAVLGEVARVAPLRPGERLSVGRYFGGIDGYQADPLAFLCGAVGSLTTWLTAPLAWSWIVTLAPELWAPIFDYLGFDRHLDIPGEQHRVAFGFDWRRIGVETWLGVMQDRELSGETGPVPAELLRPAPLDRATFERAARDGLRQLHTPAALAANPLTGSRLVAVRDDRASELGQIMRAAVQFVGTGVHGQELQRVLDRTFLHPAPSQEAAAEVLGLSFSTYRRRLAAAIDAVTDVLWAVEIGERGDIGETSDQQLTNGWSGT